MPSHVPQPYSAAAAAVVAAHDPSTPLFLYVAWNAVHNDVSIPEGAFF